MTQRQWWIAVSFLLVVIVIQAYFNVSPALQNFSARAELEPVIQELEEENTTLDFQIGVAKKVCKQVERDQRKLMKVHDAILIEILAKEYGIEKRNQEITKLVAYVKFLQLLMDGNGIVYPDYVSVDKQDEIFEYVEDILAEKE